ncbi:FGGY-family carbohydrate kinase [Herbaspirillum sp. B65]|uniref:FGGY-family carbohydrate kinase n=1 Tax=Herbaspirillum sp. B65 TaxID=137708 RepID=UPI00034A6880|nr:FGGY family carbohydrate kinase [Herbaspirillum sp. B65]
MHADAIAVFDIGKTNIKLTLVDAQGKELVVRRRANQPRDDGQYPHHDVAAIETWLLDNLAELAHRWRIRAIVPVTHGATAALVDEAGIVLPVADYEFDFELGAEHPPYETLRPPFAQSASPLLGAGLNLGRQLYWQSRQFPQAFARARYLLMYPQYWSWRLSGVAAAELSSLGCHTDLWQPEQHCYSSLPAQCNWMPLMPPLRRAWERLGPVRPELARRTGLPADCAVLCGVHDSNASLLRYLRGDDDGPRIVLSSGTWLIAAALDGRVSSLREEGDMLANVNVLGAPVACMRFMGGREFAHLAGDDVACNQEQLQALIDAQVFALPCFSEYGGPFAGIAGNIIGSLPDQPGSRYALATLYCALMTDYCLSALDVPGDIVVEGSFTANPHFAALLATLASRGVYRSNDASGTTLGGWLLEQWEQPRPAPKLPGLLPVAPFRMQGLGAYREKWLRRIHEAQQVAA